MAANKLKIISRHVYSIQYLLKEQGAQSRIGITGYWRKTKSWAYQSEVR